MSGSELRDYAISILTANDRGGYTVPTAGLYPYQWNWDSAFVALGVAEFDRDRAWQELETLVSGQWDDGMIPHIIFHREDPGYFPGPSVWQTGRQPATSGITQPPILASVVHDLWRAEGARPDHPRMRTLANACLRSHRWFHRHRDPLGNGLVMAVHNWETGRDNSPEWDDALSRVDTSKVEPYQRLDTDHVDASMRPTALDYDRYVAILQFGRGTGWHPATIARDGPFRVIDVGMSLELLRANRDLLAMMRTMGEHEAVAELEARIALSEAGTDWLWSEEVGAYCSRDASTGASSGLVTSASFLAFYAGVGGREQRERLISKLDRMAQASEFLIPSLDPESSKFDHLRYWRGPVWLVINYMVARGLAEAGHQSWADRIREDSARLVQTSGFNEAFSPDTGAGSGGAEFSWTAAMWLAWCGAEQNP